MPFYANHWAKSLKSLLGVRPKYIFVAINNLSYANSSGSAQSYEDKKQLLRIAICEVS